MRKLSYLLLGVFAVWNINLTSSTTRHRTGETAADFARRNLYAMAIGATAGALIYRRRDD